MSLASHDLTSPAPETSFKLKILGGENEGGSFTLKPARYTIGSGSMDTVVLSDPAINKTHLTVVFADNVLSILKMNGEDLAIDGQKVVTLPVDVTALQLVTIGQTGFAFGPIDADFPEMITGGGGALSSPRGKKSRAFASFQRISPDMTEKILKKVATYAAMLVIGGIIFYTGFHFLFLKKHKANTRKARIILETQMDIQPAFRFLYLTEDDTVKGYIEQSNDIPHLHRWTDPARVKLDITTLTELNKTATSTAQEFGLGNELSYHFLPIPGGKEINLNIRGVVENKDSLETFQEKLKTVLPNLQTLKLYIQSKEDILTSFKNLKAKNRAFLSVSASFEAPDNHLLLTGQLAGNFRTSWQNSLNKWQAAQPSTPEIDDQITTSPRFTGKIEGVLVGRQAFVDVRFSGENRTRRLGVGSSTPDGFTIHKITSRIVWLNNKGQIFPLPVNR